MIFTQKWIEDAVRKVLNNQDGVITEADIAQIKYLRIGETFDNGFLVEISLKNPPLPFASTDGGDEWAFCCVRGDNLKNFIDETIEEEKDSTDIQLSLGLSDYKDKEMRQYAYSNKAENLWNTFEESIISNVYYENFEKFEDDEAYDAWYEQVQMNTVKDIANFKNVQVLRINGLLFNDFKIFKELAELKVLELVETTFSSIEGMEELKKLEQFCCWLD